MAEAERGSLREEPSSHAAVDAAAATASTSSERTDPLRTVAIVLALAAGFAFLPRVMNSLTTPAERDAPDFTATVVANADTPEKKMLSLSELRGKPVLLDFWATWCGPCQVELPIVNAVADRFRDRGLVVVGVNTSDAPGLAERHAKKRGLGFPIVYDDQNDIAHHFGVDNLPTLIVISKTGKIIAVRHGVTSDSDLERLVKEVL